MWNVLAGQSFPLLCTLTLTPQRQRCLSLWRCFRRHRKSQKRGDYSGQCDASCLYSTRCKQTTNKMTEITLSLFRSVMFSDCSWTLGWNLIPGPNRLQWLGGEFICFKTCNKLIKGRRCDCRDWNMIYECYSWHIGVPVPQPRDLRLIQSSSEALLELLSVRCVLQVFSVRNRWRTARLSDVFLLDTSIVVFLKCTSFLYTICSRRRFWATDVCACFLTAWCEAPLLVVRAALSWLGQGS